MINKVIESSISKVDNLSSASSLSTSPVAQILGSGMAGTIETGLFHPFDTLIKRWQNNNTKVKFFTRDSTEAGKVIFRDAYNKSHLNKLGSLYSGLSLGAVYKITQRMYKFGGQPVVKHSLENSAISQYYEQLVGKSNADTLLRATAGGIIGVGEAVLILPLDALKVKYQTNPAEFKKYNVMQVIKIEKLNLYNGLGWTIARNLPGSFTLFGVEAATKKYIFQLDRHNEAKAWQTVIASAAGTTASICLTNPLDVVKTRIQARSGAVTGFPLAIEMIKKEGIKAFCKGSMLKLLTQGPKLTISFALSQILTQTLDEHINGANKKLSSLPDCSNPYIFFPPTAKKFRVKGEPAPVVATQSVSETSPMFKNETK